MYRPALLKGDMPQKERVTSLRLFARGTRPLLVATDVAGRGLDVPDVAYVINYGGFMYIIMVALYSRFYVYFGSGFMNILMSRMRPTSLIMERIRGNCSL